MEEYNAHGKYVAECVANAEFSMTFLQEIQSPSHFGSRCSLSLCFRPVGCMSQALRLFDRTSDVLG